MTNCDNNNININIGASFLVIVMDLDAIIVSWLMDVADETSKQLFFQQ